MGSKQNDMIDAAKQGRIEKVNTLLNDKSVDINGKSSGGLTALHCASIEGHRNISELLLDRGADIEARTPYWDDTPLIRACARGHESIVELLLNRGADVHAVNKKRDDALRHATLYGCDGVVKLLLDYGANANACTVKNNWIPLHEACFHGHVKCVKELLSHGVGVDVKSNKGNTPLDLARQKGHEPIVKLMEEHMKAQQRRNIDQAEKNHTDSIAWGKVSSKPNKTVDDSCNEVVTNTSTQSFELKIKHLIEIHRTDLGKKLKVLEEKHKMHHSQFIDLENKMKVSEAKKHSQWTTISDEVTSNLAKVQEVLEKQINNQQAALVKENMVLLEKKLVSTIQETLKRQVSEAKKKDSLYANKATTDALMNKIQVLETQLNDQHSLVDQNIETAVEKMLASKIQDAMDQHGSKSPFKRRATDDNINGPSNKRLKVTNDKNETAQMMSLEEEEEGAVGAAFSIQEMVELKAIQQSFANMNQKSFRKELICIGLCGALKFMYVRMMI